MNPAATSGTPTLTRLRSQPCGPSLHKGRREVAREGLSPDGRDSRLAARERAFISRATGILSQDAA
jgi:hypothetical protein